MKRKITSLFLLLFFLLTFFPLQAQAAPRSSMNKSPGGVVLKDQPQERLLPQDLPGGSTTAFAWRAYSNTGQPLGLISLSIPDGIQTMIKEFPGDGSSFMSGADFVGDQLFMIDYSGRFYEVNYTTGDLRLIGSTGLTTTGFAYDTSEDRAYVLTGNAVYSINLDTAAVTYLYPLGDGSLLFIDFAFNATGELYAADIVTDQLYKVNKTSGALTPVGPIGVDLNFAQGMSFDREQGILYGTLYESGGISGVYSISALTGAATKLSSFMDEIDGLAIPYESYSVVFYDGDTLLKKTFVLSETQEVMKPSAPEKEEKIFTGWNTRADGTGTHYEPEEALYVADDTTLYAQYQVKTYHVLYHGNGAPGGEAPLDETHYLKGETAELLENTFLYPGQEFLGWNTKEDGTGTAYAPEDTFTFGSEDLHLYAQWELAEYTLTYDGNGHTEGTVPVDENAYHMADEVEVLSGTMTKRGFVFHSWNTRKDGTGVEYLPEDLLLIETESVVLYAQWTPVMYTVSFQGNGSTGGTLPEAEEQVLGGAVTVPESSLLRAGYRFTGWNTKEDGTGTAYAPGDLLILETEEVVLYAQWTEETYTLTYDAGGGKGSLPVDSHFYRLGETVTVKPHSLTKAGYSFSGWNTRKDGTGKYYQPGNTFPMPEVDLVLYAQWTEVLPKTGTSSTFLVYGSGLLFILAGALTLAKKEEKL